MFGYTRLMVGAMGLGAGEAAIEIAIPYAKERIQFKTPLSEKQGYTHKLIVPNVVRLAAAEAYLEEVGERLDAGETDLEVEGSIAKWYATEAGNRSAEDSMQALGGYGYITEYAVEKIKRDVRITTIYEGTSEIQQNIISTFRWKKTRKTKGEFYGAMPSGDGASGRNRPGGRRPVFRLGRPGAQPPDGHGRHPSPHPAAGAHVRPGGDDGPRRNRRRRRPPRGRPRRGRRPAGGARRAGRADLRQRGVPGLRPQHPADSVGTGELDPQAVAASLAEINTPNSAAASGA